MAGRPRKPTNAHDGARLPELLDPQAFGSGVWADTAYRSHKNEEVIAKAGRTSKIHFRRARGKPLPPAHQCANRARSKVRGLVEHVFAEQKERMRLFVRTVGLGRASAKIGLAKIAYNIKRCVCLDAQRA